MTRITGTTWLRGACIFSVFLIGTSQGVLPQPASAAPKVPPVQSLVVEYSLAPGEVSAEITPVVNQPVLVMGANTSFFTPGMAQVTMLHSVTVESGVALFWVGLEAPPSSTITSGYVPGPGCEFCAATHIVFLDYAGFSGHLVELEATSGNTFRIHNRSTLPQTGYVKLMW